MQRDPWDLVICSESLNRLDRRRLNEALRWFEFQLSLGGVVVAANRRDPETPADYTHDLLGAELAHWHTRDERTDDFRLDCFDGRRRTLKAA